MPLSEKYADNFTEEARNAGEGLLGKRLVNILLGAPDSISCEVQDGTALHDTRWNVVANRLVPRCECDDFTVRHVLCPHLWAALLSADGSGDLLQALKHNVPRRIVIPVAQAPQTDATYLPETRQATRRRAAAPQASSGPSLDFTDSQACSRRPEPRAVVPQVQPGLSQQTDILFILKLEDQQPDSLVLQLAWRPFSAPGAPPPPAKPLVLSADSIIDSPVLAKVLSWQSAGHGASRVVIAPPHLRDFLDALDGHNLVRWMASSQKPVKVHPVQPVLARGIHFALQWREETPASPPHPYVAMGGVFELPTGTVSMQGVLHLWRTGLVLTQERLFLADLRKQEALAATLVGKPPRVLSTDAASDIVRNLMVNDGWPKDDFPPFLLPTIGAPPPRPRLFVRTAKYKYQGREQLHADLSFDYGGTLVPYGETAELVQNDRTHAVIRRNQTAENGFVLRLQSLDFRWNDRKTDEELGWKLAPAMLDNAVRSLVLDDWFVSAQGKDYRKPTTKTAAIVSRIDWFELEASVSFDGFTVPLPDLIKARQEGRSSVRLDDGTFGLLPLEWLENFTALTEIGDVASDKIRFRQQQAAIVQSLIENATVHFDETFSRLASQATDDALPDCPPSPQFQATLRPYQQEGLNWLLSMRSRGMGACLADDMGLGKTIQILAFLDARHQEMPGKPSLVVMPKSLIFNWMEEAKRFAPHLKACAYTGAGRSRLLLDFPHLDVVFTTYGTLRNDIAALGRMAFDTCILDESQVIKNADSTTAEACRAIQADFRIAMTGTPIENKLSELFSQLDFLNPGLMGRLLKDDSLAASRLPRDTFLKVRRAVRCFILRRTKQMVAKNLPPKTEQILWCQLDDAHKAEYDALKEHYRQQLLDGPQEGGAMAALAALLRLRQAACHPALVFQNRQFDESEKITLLCDQLSQLIGQGHKALVFSQFTSLLKFVQDKLSQLAIQFVYLDGQTKDRQALVNQFQTDENTKVFLISLKAGGVGLNLTAADYIFLLDPWWNPATEAQAIDRAFRIGQTRPVFAYRLITKDTIEEKVLQMQNAKRRLADAYLKETPEPTALSKDDLRFLLS